MRSLFEVHSLCHGMADTVTSITVTSHENDSIKATQKKLLV